MKNKITYLSIATCSLLLVGANSIGLASMLGVSTTAANKVINIIDAGSTIATIISIATSVVGAGLITAGIVATAKKMIKKYGKKYAAAW